MVTSTTRSGRGGILRIDFPGFSGERSLKEVSWDDFFEKFEESQLAFLYQDRTSSGRPSRFNKLVARASLAEGAERASAKPRAARAVKKARSGTRRSGTASTTAKKAAAKKATGKRAGATRARRPSAATSARGASPRRARQSPGQAKKKASKQSQKRSAE